MLIKGDQMAVMSQPATPTVAIARTLRRLGLEQGHGKDFRVEGAYRNGVRLHTFVLLLTRHAEEVVAANADRIEEAPELGGYAFTVSVRYFNGRAVPSVRNGACDRIREEAPVAASPVAATGANEATEATEPSPPAVDHREQYRREEQAKALGWSTGHAEAVRRAAAGELVRDADGVPRRVTRAGRIGARVAFDRLVPLEAAGYLKTAPAGDGATRIEATADGRRALLVWDAARPSPVERTRKQERLPLRPLLGGEEARRRAEVFAADEQARRIARDEWYAAAELRWAEEDREQRHWNAWARVEGVRYSWRKRPRGWVPTDEEIYLHMLDPEVVAELRTEAAELAAEAEPTAPDVEIEAVEEHAEPGTGIDSAYQVGLLCTRNAVRDSRRNPMARITCKPFAPKAYDLGSWVTWTDADGVTRHGQITDQAPAGGTWWITSAAADDRIETYLLNRLAIRTHRDRRERDERIAAGGDKYLYEVRAIAYTRNERGEVHGVAADRIAPAVSCQEPPAESLARNGQTVIPLETGEAAAVVGAPAEDAEVELWDGVVGIIAGPGVVQPGVHVEYLPQHRPGPRTRHCHGGVIISVGTTCVRWRPCAADKDVRTPLEHMRVDTCSHINMREDVRRAIRALDAGRPLPKQPEWVVWSLARHLEHAAAEVAAAEAVAEEAAAGQPIGRVVIIPCGAAKLDRSAAAGELYVGSYHRACRRAADALTATGGTVLVLSALYGLAPLERVLQPYELRMGQPGSITADRLQAQAQELGLDRAADVTVLAGVTYAAAALEIWPQASTPLAGLGGMGYQLRALAALAGGGVPPEALGVARLDSEGADSGRAAQAGAVKAGAAAGYLGAVSNLVHATPRGSSRPTELTCVLSRHTLYAVGPENPGGAPDEHHDQDPQHRGRRRHHRGPGRQGHRCGRPQGAQHRGGRRPDPRRRHAPGHPPLLHPEPRQGGSHRSRRAHRHRSVARRPLLQLGQHPHRQLTSPGRAHRYGARPPPPTRTAPRRPHEPHQRHCSHRRRLHRPRGLDPHLRRGHRPPRPHDGRSAPPLGPPGGRPRRRHHPGRGLRGARD
ncbi:DUF6884 domain-containing protein [Streptomyces sp. NPDC057456]|uniref:DUF6884 domain-containing protein n=1 Tax=Streptomyces sp. NPDC057456 TaxID=3346139 RepID=UPI0036BEA158